MKLLIEAIGWSYIMFGVAVCARAYLKSNEKKLPVIFRIDTLWK